MAPQDIVVVFNESSGIDVRPDAGVPAPFLLGSELTTILVYRGSGTIVARFLRCHVSKFGYPNDEALAGHPLYAGGLRYYGVFRVENSSWIKTLANQNRVCFPKHAAFSRSRHFAITFHDSTFECIAEDVAFERHLTPLRDVVETVMASFDGGLNE